MTSTTRKLRVLPALGLAAALGLVSPAAASTQQRRAQTFVIVAHELGTGSGRLVTTGPIHGVGTDTVVAHLDNPDGTFTDTDRFDLPDGQVELTDTYTADITFDPASCRYTIAVAGTYRISGATGAFTGATGGGTFTSHGLIVTGRDPSGACLGLDSGAPPIAYTEVARGVGTTTLPRAGG